MDWGQLFFSYNGRISRLEYWLACTGYVIVQLVLTLLEGLSDSVALAALISIVTIGLFVSSLAVAIKRLHDRNKSGWYAVLFYVLPAVLFLLGMMIGITRDGSTTLAYALWLAALGLSIWGFVELGFLRGSAGVNPYGPDPLTPTPATH